MRTFGQILIGIILGALVGGGCMWAYIAYSDYRQEQKELAQQKVDRRQAHKDSLMRIRAMQDEHLQVEEKVEAERQLMCEYLTTFYREEIFGDHSSSLKPFLDDSCHAERSDFLPYTSEKLSKDNRRIMEKRLRIAHDHDDWYRVHLVVDGATTYRYVQAKRKGKDIVIYNIR